jgi:tetratricopeptide (TPR) repeat protein
MDNIAPQALEALRLENPNEARIKLEELIEQAPERLDLRHSLAVTLLKMGEAKAAKLVIEDAIEMAFETKNEAAATTLSQLYMAQAECCLDLYLPRQAEQAYQRILQDDPENPYALQALAYLLFKWGRVEQGISILEQYVKGQNDEQEALEGNRAFLDAVKLFISNDVHPREFLNAHHGSYQEFFKHHAAEMAKKGWLPEQPYVQQLEDGNFVYAIREGDRPYATARVDLIDPDTMQGGRVGDQPMIVALADYQPLAHAPVLFTWPGQSFHVLISSNCPWNNLSIHIRTLDGTWQDLDAYIGDWYRDGFLGEFGSETEGFFHEIGFPQEIDENSVNYYLDCGCAGVEAIENLLKRLEIAHSQFGIDAIIIGEGFLS